MTEKAEEQKRNLRIQCPYCRKEQKIMTMGKSWRRVCEKLLKEDREMVEAIYKDPFLRTKAEEADMSYIGFQ